MDANDWYWIDGTAYCPSCVECDTPAADTANCARGPSGGIRCACCHETDWTDADRTQQLYREAEARVRGNDRLATHAATILDDHGEGDDHWRWVIDADADEILDWAKAHR